MSQKQDEYWSAGEYDGEAQRLYDAGDYEAALLLLREGLERHPDSVELRVSLGYTQLARQEFGWARAAFETALEAEPDHEEGLVGLGDALLKLGERSRALLIFERILEMGFGGDSALMLAVGRALYREGLYQRAERFYRRARAADQQNAEAAAELGYTLYQRGHATSALSYLSEALELRENFHEVRVFYGNLLYDGGDYSGALEQFEQIPAGEMWDPLAVWRALELMRGFRRAEDDGDMVDRYLEQLERLHEDPSPEERLLAEVEASSAGDRVPGDRHQLDLFALEPAEESGGEPEVHTVRARNGQIFVGDWLSIVRAMRDNSATPTLPVTEYMREGARFVEHLTGVEIPEDDPEAFIRGSARAGILRIEG